MEAVQLIKDYTTKNGRSVVEFYLDTNSTWDYHELIRHLRTSFKSGKAVSSLVSDFYSRVQWSQEKEDQFADELKILCWKVISVRPAWKDEVNKAKVGIRIGYKVTESKTYHEQC